MVVWWEERTEYGGPYMMLGGVAGEAADIGHGLCVLGALGRVRGDEQGR